LLTQGRATGLYGGGGGGELLTEEQGPREIRLGGPKARGRELGSGGIFMRGDRESSNLGMRSCKRLRGGRKLFIRYARAEKEKSLGVELKTGRKKKGVEG